MARVTCVITCFRPVLTVSVFYSHVYTGSRKPIASFIVCGIGMLCIWWKYAFNDGLIKYIITLGICNHESVDVYDFLVLLLCIAWHATLTAYD